MRCSITPHRHSAAADGGGKPPPSAALRTRAAGMFAGWFAYWERDGLRYRVYPGRGSPLDLPVPLSDLALGRTATPERLAALVELLAEVGARGIVATDRAAQLARSAGSRGRRRAARRPSSPEPEKKDAS